MSMVTLGEEGTTLLQGVRSGRQSDRKKEDVSNVPPQLVATSNISGTKRRRLKYSSIQLGTELEV